MKATLLALVAALLALLPGTAAAATKLAGGRCCPPCPFCG